MAADLNPDWISCLPSSWSYGVIRDGRVFFINEEAKSTTWLHPVTGEAVITGHRKTPDLPTGWEEGYTFEGARCFINHNERKVTCKHPVSGAPSQDNCIFVVNEQPATKAAAAEKKERPTSIMSEASNYTGGSDYMTQPSSPTTRQSRSSKKVHNFGKRSHSIKRNPNAPIVKRSWLYKQDSTGMKMWKKRWFVLSDMCLFYYKDEKEEGILGSILLPSFHISLLSVDDHISKKYAFKATHPNMRTYYFCTDTAKEMESWMKVMTDATLVHTEPTKRLEKVDPRSPLEMNNMLNHWVLTQPEIQNNERNRESLYHEDKKQKHLEKQPRIHREKERCTVHKDSEKYHVSKEGEKYALEKDGQKYPVPKSGYRYMLQKDVEMLGVQIDGEKYTSTLQKESKRHTLQREEEINLLQKEMQRYTLHKDGDKHALPKDNETHSVHKDSEKYLQKDGGRPTQKATVQKEPERSRLQREEEKYGMQKDGNAEQPLGQLDSSQLQPAQAATVIPTLSSSWQLKNRGGSTQYKAAQVNGSGEQSPEEMSNTISQRTAVQPQQAAEPERSLSRSNSIQLEQHFRTHRTRVQDDETKSITSYQTLPRNMPSHRTQVVPRYPEGYRTLPRNMLRPDSICSVAGSVYDCALQPVAAEKRRSMRDDTLWQLYEWQQRQAYSRMGYSTLPSPKTLSHIAESIPSSPSHGSLGLYHSASPNRAYNPSTCSEVSSPVFRGDVSIDRRYRAHLAKPEELTLLLIKLRRQQAELNSIREQTLAQLMQLNIDASNPKNKVLSHHLQRNLMYLDSQMKQNEPIIFMIHTMIESSAPRPQLYQQMSPEAYSDSIYGYRSEELDVDAKLSRLCEQGKVVRTQEEKLQQLHREKHTLETALLSASQELEMSADNPAAVQSLIQQRDVLQSGLLSSCRELSRVSTELDRSWKEYDKLENAVTLAKRNLLDQLEALGSPQTEPPSQQHVQIQKELWRIQDVMDALNKNKPKRSTEPSFPLSGLQKKEESDSVPPRPPLPHIYEGRGRLCATHLPGPSHTQLHPPRPGPHQPEDRKAAQRNGGHSGPDYRLYKSEPELTTVAEVDESNGEEKSEQTAEKEPSSSKVSYPVGVVSPRTKSPMPVSSTIASYVTLRKAKKPEPKTNCPNSTAEHMSSGVEGVRHRMSVEEQMERIRRHQQGALRERRREDGSLSRSLSFTKDTPHYYTLQMSTKRRELSVGDSNQIKATLFKEKWPVEQEQGDRLSESVFGEKVSESSRSLEKRKPLGTEDSVQTAVMVRVGTEENDDDESLSVQSHDHIIKESYNLTSSKHSTTVSVNSLSSSPQSPSSSPLPSSPPHLPDGSHFMCV
ncbi:pleckstrin homology domain-containing family A member 5 isoform X3 [Silurus meridionalis]|uniref:pleckstrin homology domain-containing family A member 5 isoform X3 n=1 Tax=Silurus meridionalis TaxID=175797 RepID=UPI001EEA4A2F|nr:pleckstrin homology domain-containing family A member 5 isoform X3 [Silurus meridionalis]